MFGLKSKYKYLLDEIEYERERRIEWDSEFIDRFKEIDARIDALMDYLGVEEKQTSGIQIVKKESKK